MRLARIEQDGKASTAYVAEDGRAYKLPTPEIGDLFALDAQGIRALDERIAAQIAKGDRTPVEPDRWLPPVDRPGKVIGVALNNSAFAPMAHRYFEKPAFFMKAPSALIGHGETVIMREDYGLTHPEPELACVIGRPMSRVAEDDAKAGVFGYTIINDITSVGLKDEDSVQLQFSSATPGQSQPQWRALRDEADLDIYLTYHLRSKCTDGFGPIGPWITTADAVPDPDALSVRAWLGERLIAEDSTARLSFSIAKVLSHLSHYVTLHPGDIVHFGTAIDPRRFALREANILRDPSDMRIEIDGLGTLVSPVRVVKD